MLLRGEAKDGDTILIDLKEDALTFTIGTIPAPPAGNEKPVKKGKSAKT